MSITFKCSDCDAPMKVGDHLAGKRCKCPKCSTVNVIPGTEPESSDGSRAASTFAAELKKPSRALADDDAPAEEPSPSRKTKSLAKKGGKKRLVIFGLLALFVCGFGCLTCTGGGVGGLWWYGIWPFGGTLAEEARYFPNDTNIIVSIRVDQLRTTRLYKDFTADIGKLGMGKLESEVEDGVGIPLADIDRVVLAVSMNKVQEGGTGEKGTYVVRTNKPVKASDILATIKIKNPKAVFIETKIGDKTIHEPKDSNSFLSSFCIVDSKTVVFANKAKTLKEVLERGMAPQLSDRLQSAIKSANFNRTLAIALDTTGPVAKEMVKEFSTKKAGDNDIPAEAIAAEIQVDSDVNATATLIFKDAKAAEDAKTKLESIRADLKNNPFLKELFKDAEELSDFKMKVSGKNLVIEQTVKGATIGKLIRKSTPLK